MNVFNIERALQQKRERLWDKIYVLVDAHGTLIKPYHNCIEFYPIAPEVMMWFNNRRDFSTILWTSSHPNEIAAITAMAGKIGFGFNFINENPREANSERACFERKFYFNILLDDKAGFEPETDWELIKLELLRLGEWHNRTNT